MPISRAGNVFLPEASGQVTVEIGTALRHHVVQQVLRPRPEIPSQPLPKGNAEAARNAHITCHAANVALYLNRQVRFDNKTNTFIDDDEANRLLSEALREPWRI